MCERLIYPIVLAFVLGLAFPGPVRGELVGWWRFDEGSGTTAGDSSGNTNDGAIRGAIWADGKYGKALRFNGQDNYVEVPTSGTLEMDGNVTVAAWINWVNAGDTWLAIMANGQQNGPWENYGLFVNRSGRFLYFTLSLDGAHVVQQTPNNVIGPDEWLHACATWDGSAARIYVNGQMKSEQARPGKLVPPKLPLRIGHRNGSPHFFNGVIDEVRIYNHALTEPEILSAMEGSKGYPYALAPSPDDGALHPATWVELRWSPGDFAVSHDVYLGESFDDVNAGTANTFRGNQGATSLLVGFVGNPYPDGLVPGTTYYWRIDEVNTADPNSPWKGDIWSFSIPPRTAYNPNPADGAQSVALNASLRWAAGFGAKLHTVYFGDSFDDVNNAASGGRLVGTTTYNPGPLASQKVYYWRVDESDPPNTYKGQIWSFATLGTVGNPYPSNGESSAEMNTILTWVAGDDAASHQVYFGPDKEAVRKAGITSPEYKGARALGGESYDPGLLARDSTYYWRVDEVNNVNPNSPWKGPLWSFTTGSFLLVDGFESYNDLNEGEPGSKRIYLTWIDGFGTTTNGAVVGNLDVPIAERIIVHSGAQSMPLAYDNNLKYSEATMTLTSGRDWTAQGVTELSLWFAGKAGNAAEKIYVALNGTAVVYHDNPNATQATAWTQWVIPLQSFANQGVNLANVTSITIGFGTRGTTTTAGGTGKMYIDDIRLYR